MLVTLRGKKPDISQATFVAPNSTLVGEVVLGKGSSVWFYAALRSEAEPITVGENSCVEDHVLMHCPKGKPVRIGNNVTVGHGSIVHGATIEDNVLIGMHATIMDGAHIGEGSLIAAGALVKEGMEIPPRSLVVGAPAKVVREVSDKQRESVANSIKAYSKLASEYAESMRNGGFEEA